MTQPEDRDLAGRGVSSQLGQWSACVDALASKRPFTWYLPPGTHGSTPDQTGVDPTYSLDSAASEELDAWIQTADETNQTNVRAFAFELDPSEPPPKLIDMLVALERVDRSMDVVRALNSQYVALASEEGADAQPRAFSTRLATSLATIEHTHLLLWRGLTDVRSQLVALSFNLRLD